MITSASTATWCCSAKNPETHSAGKCLLKLLYYLPYRHLAPVVALPSDALILSRIYGLSLTTPSGMVTSDLHGRRRSIHCYEYEWPGEAGRCIPVGSHDGMIIAGLRVLGSVFPNS